MESINNLNFIDDLKASFALVDNIDIQNGIMCYCLDALNKPYDMYCIHRAKDVFDTLKTQNMPTDLEIVIDIFESLLKT